MDEIIKAKKFGELFETYFTDESQLTQKVSYDALFYFELGGEGKLTVGKQEYLLHSGDFIYCEPGVPFSYFLKGRDKLIFIIRINYMGLCRSVGADDVRIACNSLMGGGRAYEDIRRILNKAVGQMQFGDEAHGMSVTGLLYELLYHLLMDFRVAEERRDETGLTDAERVHKIVNYINVNCRQDITLERLADYLGLTPEYTSRYVKRKLGCSFKKYLSEIRVIHAAEELLNTDASILDIAMNNGFAGPAALSSGIKEKYGMTPHEYRKSHKKAEDAEEQKKASGEMQRQLSEYIKNHPEKRETAENVIREEIRIDSRVTRPYRRNWDVLLNVGAVRNLLMREAQDEIKMLRDNLGIKYVRFRDIWDPELYLLRKNLKEDAYNWLRLDHIIAFLTAGGMYPYIEIPADTRVVVGGSSGTESYFERIGDYENFVEALANHYYLIYGREEISKWIYEVTYVPEAGSRIYYQILKATRRALKNCSEDIRVGGCYYFDQDMESLETGLAEWKKMEGTEPDFISLCCCPGKNDFFPVYDPDYLRNKLRHVKEALKRVGWEEKKLVVSSWNFTASNRNALNDVLFKGSYIMRNVIASIGEVEVLGYGIGSDLFNEYNGYSGFMNGSGGLLSHSGVAKPGFFAMYFCGRLKKFLVSRNAYSVVTTDNYGHFAIVCHNYKHPNFYYYQLKDEETRLEDMEQYFSDASLLKLQFRIEGVRDGEWLIRCWKVDSNNGNLVWYWEKTGYSHMLDGEDIHYLDHVCRPQLSIRKTTVREGLLEFDTWLQPNEFQYIHIIHNREQK